MRLSSLKLSGFKSFADSTTLHFKANRSAIVGPNGCGKSNVIDAIRWVMGESSARQLRGGSMQDVIFTGTVKRKPVGVASVELRFENTYGKLGGMYNAYNELAVRRQVTREGKSEYFLNGTRCRRRDITDIFLGTGLGPRSYAIIEQGMINRLVDAKPEEMRVFVEEAAGVSRYQARRRETLQHLEHTTQNLERLDDIAHELKSQLKTLKRQSEAAVQYKQLEQQIRTLKIEILSFQCQQSQRLQQEYTAQMTESGEQFKLVRSELSTVEHDLTETSGLFQRLIQQSTPLQQAWQTAEKKLSELQLNVEQKQALQQQNSQQISQLEQQKTQLKEQLQLTEMQLDTLHEQCEQLAESVQQAEQNDQQQQQQNSDLSAQYQTALQQYQQVKSQVEQQQQKHAQMQSQLEQLNKNLLRLEHQKETLTQQYQQVKAQVAQPELEDFTEQQHSVAEQVQHTEQQLQLLEQQKQQQQQAVQQQQQQLSAQQSQLKILQAEQTNLQKLMTKQQPKQQSTTQQLMQILQLQDVAKAHAGLVEKFLAQWLSAHVRPEAEQFHPEQARQLQISEVMQQTELLGLPTLASWIAYPQNSLWQQVAIAADFTQALALQKQLQTGQTLLSLDGYLLGQDWVIGLLYDEQSQAAQGALSHRIRLQEIEQELAEGQQQLQQLQQLSSSAEQTLKATQQQIQEQQQYSKNLRQQQQQLDVQLAKLHSAQQAFALQQQQLQTQLQQLDLQIEEDAMQKDDLEIDLHALAIKLEQVLPNYKILQFQVDELAEQCEQQQRQRQQVQSQLQDSKQQLQQQQQQIELLEKDLSFLKSQYAQCVQQLQQAQSVLQPIQLELPSLQVQLEEQQQQTAVLEKQWKEWQLELNTVQEKQQHLTQQRHQLEQQDEQVRELLEQKRLAWQAAKSDLTHYTEQLEQLNAEPLKNVVIELVAHQAQLQKAQQQFDKIGAVNLAASQEYEEVAGRYEELTHQMQDLQNTVEQLQQAMKSIDQETRKLFMQTFEQINHELQDLFPKVFNGGEASLSLEDDWQSGVKLMARPPGKRNSSLALLSGGEKALTALALVFAIFRLNPAPFCVLDEVDAPLDDANVQRFCNLVKELSEQVQFVYITHNKLAMTMATDLLGVTMPEPGTSKLVTVNLEEAKEYGLVAES
ncbi:chromosome segregation protein SMC [Acinetobacter sp. ANC 4641]|uniref:chromosome segregation protein SMC n=1 Tax=Acinetobacter sp. ANC 4641 TaxID=2529847 RepID=UPI00103B44F1|nr:chromosome segregation protein SMC [Acinetobacter sp. ANC 4641]TCB08324.1 chromosome segregation protein SMC [Acinetobacter sp. ANC 4641]